MIGTLRKTIGIAVFGIAIGTGIATGTAIGKPIAGTGSETGSVCPLVAHPADSCREDEIFAPTHWRDPEGIETEFDSVTRKCQPIDGYVFGGNWEPGS